MQAFFLVRAFCEGRLCCKVSAAGLAATRRAHLQDSPRPSCEPQPAALVLNHQSCAALQVGQLNVPTLPSNYREAANEMSFVQLQFP